MEEMQITYHDDLRSVVKLLENAIEKNPKMSAALADCDISIGPSTDKRFRTPMHAIQQPQFVGDKHWIGDMVASAELRELSKKKPSEVLLVPRWNARTNRFDQYAVRSRDFLRGVVHDAIFDAAPDLMLTQQVSPWNASWFQKLFKAPLLYSHAQEAVEMWTGDNPWAEVMNLMLADYAGFGVFENSGGVDNTLTQPVNVQSGLMSSVILNMTTTYSLALEELKRSDNVNNPLGNQLITEKEAYAAYVLNMLTDYLIIYGNTPTATVGLLQVPSSVTSYSPTSLNGIALGSSTTMGSDMYKGLIGILEPYLTVNFNKVEEVTVMLSPKAHNLLRSYPYSQAYNPESAIQAWADNFAAGMGKTGQAPTIKFVSEPLLAATASGVSSNPFNSNTFDYTIICASSIKAGAKEEAQPLLLAGMPLKDFSYPVIPAGYASTFKFLRRYAGLFPIVQSTVVVYSGFGMKSAST
jgi:hypothetical protein